MKHNATSEIIDSIFAEFGVLVSKPDRKETSKPMTFWLPTEYKAKYESLQRQSGGQFGRLLKEVLKRSIDRANFAKSDHSLREMPPTPPPF